jgi:carboxymethylenebutenolidase
MSDERRKAADFPQEVLSLFDQYVHGIIDRRAFLDGAAKFAVGGTTAGAMLDALRPRYAWAQQVPPDDARIQASIRRVPSPTGLRHHAWAARAA